MLEATFKRRFKERLHTRMQELGVDIFIIDNKSNRRSTLDTIVLGPQHWAALEFKRSKSASHRPNQDYYVDQWDQLGFASFVYPENEEEILNELEKLFTSVW